MKNRKSLSCRMPGCADATHLGGLCRKHYAEHEHQAERRRAANAALHAGTIDDRVPDVPALREEFNRLLEWWRRACQVVQTKRGTEFMPADEAEYALDWCIALAAEIIDAERAARAGAESPDSLESTRAWVWDRFRNLEAGLRSNGTVRTAR
ncbi:MAG: hypothetical protein WC830_22145 [Burkholderiales bacterium]|jgi:hypothetical protein